MPKLAKPLTELEVRKAKPQERAYMLADGKGLHLSVSPTGLKSWVLRFRLPGSRTATPATIGHYPTMSLAEARARALETARDAKVGVATAGVRKAMRSVIEADIARKDHQALAEAQAREAQLEAVATRWLAENRDRWQSETFRKARLVVESYFIPKLGAADLRTLQTKDVRPLLLEMSSKVPQLARKARQYMGQIVEHAINEGLRSEDSTLRLARILPKAKLGHMPAITEKEGRLGELMRSIDVYENRVVRAALILLTLTVMRPGVVASARWSEFDLEKAEWAVPGMEPDGVTNRMKTGQDFTTPLPRQAVMALKEMHRRSSGEEYVFPPQARQQSLHLSRDALSKAVREMGFKGEHSPHGFRATWRTLGRERLKIEVDVLECQLAHAPKSETEAAYARMKFLHERCRVLQEWANYLDRLRDDAEVVPLKKSA